MSKELTKEQEKEIQKIIDEINEAAKAVIEDYTKTPSEISGSIIQIHEDSPLLQEDSLDIEVIKDEKIFDKVNKVAGVTILEGNEREAVDQFNWEVHQRALQIQGAANAENVTLTYKTAYDQAWTEKSAEAAALAEQILGA